jgi:hypothetical protein
VAGKGHAGAGQREAILNQRQVKDQPPKVESAAKPFRCHCGSLLARLVPEGVELKCRRCKRRIVVHLVGADFQQPKDQRSEPTF